MLLKYRANTKWSKVEYYTKNFGFKVTWGHLSACFNS